jgi:hypothetical protein
MANSLQFTKYFLEVISPRGEGGTELLVSLQVGNELRERLVNVGSDKPSPDPCRSLHLLL